MGAFGIDSTSKNKQVSQTVSDQGVFLDRNSSFASPYSTVVNAKKSQLAPNYTVKKNGTLTINNGVGSDELQSLFGNVTQATGAQIAALSSGNSEQLDKLTGLLSQKETTVADKQDAAAGSPKTLFWVVIAALAVLAFYLFKK